MKSTLFADNDPDFLNTRAEFLEQAGYRVVKASTLAEAERFLRDKWAPLAILDVRLVDDDDDKDLSGIGLAKMESCRAIAKIVLTNYPTHDTARQSLKSSDGGRPLAIDYLAKEEGPEAMVEAVEQAFAQHVHINWDLVIRWNAAHPLSFPHLAHLIEPELPKERLADRADELEDLFRRLFYEKSQITIDRLLWQRNERVALTVFTFAPDKPSESFVIICGPPARILDEWQRYRKFAPARVGADGATLATVSDCAETTHFAAYALAGIPVDKSFQTLKEFYHSNPERRGIQTVIDSLGATLAAWHRGGRVPAEPPVGEPELYRALLGLAQMTPADLEAQLSTLQREAATFGLTLTFTDEACRVLFNTGQAVAFPSPHAFLFEAQTHDTPTALCAIVPGTLSPENILIAPKGGPAWFTDFAEAGLAPPSWNFTALEAALRFDLAAGEDLAQRNEMEERLTEPGALDRVDTQTHVDKPVRPTLQWIELVRRKAAEVVGRDAEAYHRGLFFQAARRLVAFQPKVRLSRDEVVRALHALLAAGLMCERTLKAQLADTGDVPVLRLDEAEEKAWVGKRAVHLTQIEFGLLAYLYSRVGQLCSHQEIIMRVWNPKENPLALRNTLNSHVERLRKKIESDSSRPRYLITEHARGYRLITQPEM